MLVCGAGRRSASAVAPASLDRSRLAAGCCRFVGDHHPHRPPHQRGAADQLGWVPARLRGALVLVGNDLAVALLYWQFDSGGTVGATRTTGPLPGVRFPATDQPGPRAAGLAARLRRLPVPRIHQQHGVQPDRRDAAGYLGQVGHGGAVNGLTRGHRPRCRSARQRSHRGYEGSRYECSAPGSARSVRRPTRRHTRC
jgi:hypothetical protein